MIEGVIITKLKKIPDERGAIFHMLRNDDPHFKKFGEIYFSIAYPGIIKGWHEHTKQVQNYAVVDGMIKLVLYDNRKKSKTYKKIKSFIIDSKKNKSVYFFPANIGHAYIALSQKNHMIYGTSGNYKTKEEYKLPFNKSLLK